MKIFVSYTTKDMHVKENYLLNIFCLLKQYGEPYIDLIHNDSINKQQRVHDELISSNIMILLHSKSIKASQWVKWEIATAKNKKIPINTINSYLPLDSLKLNFDKIFNKNS